MQNEIKLFSASKCPSPPFQKTNQLLLTMPVFPFHPQTALLWLFIRRHIWRTNLFVDCSSSAE